MSTLCPRHGAHHHFNLMPPAWFPPPCQHCVPILVPAIGATLIFPSMLVDTVFSASTNHHADRLSPSVFPFIVSTLSPRLGAHRNVNLVSPFHPPGERRISEISPPLLRGSELYKNLSFSRPMSIFCLLDPLLSPFTKLFPPFFFQPSFFF